MIMIALFLDQYTIFQQTMLTYTYILFTTSVAICVEKIVFYWQQLTPINQNTTAKDFRGRSHLVLSCGISSM